MKIENQVCSLEQAKKLQEFGINCNAYQYAYVDFSVQSGQEAVLCRPASHVEEHSREWAWFMVGSHTEEIQVELDEDSVNAEGGVYPAFTVTELGRMIGAFSNKGIYEQSDNFKMKHPDIEDDTANMWNPICLADMLIDALGNNIVTPEELNNRLND